MPDESSGDETSRFIDNRDYLRPQALTGLHCYCALLDLQFECFVQMEQIAISGHWRDQCARNNFENFKMQAVTFFFSSAF